MKRKCKNVNIYDLEFIQKSIFDCLTNKCKKRGDVKKLLSKYETVEDLALCLQKEMLDKKLILKKIVYKEKYDVSSNKTRVIGVQDIKQQIYDYIAVNGLEEVLKRIGTYQCASVKGRGQEYGVKQIYKWLQNPNINYACKMDIKKYYESIPKDKIMLYLKKYVKNDDLLWLIETLLDTFDKGLSIGSYLSQHLGNLYLSSLYHKIYEDMYRIRRKRNGKTEKVRYVKHALFYMDDILILGTNSKDLLKAKDIIIEELSKYGLSIKPTWRNFKIDNGFIDMMGYRIYKDHITIRRTTFKVIRRAFLRYKRNTSNIHLAKRCISYKGKLNHSDSLKFISIYKVIKLITEARKEVSYDSKKRYATTDCPLNYIRWKYNGVYQC